MVWKFSQQSFPRTGDFISSPRMPLTSHHPLSPNTLQPKREPRLTQLLTKDSVTFRRDVFES